MKLKPKWSEKRTVGEAVRLKTSRPTAIMRLNANVSERPTLSRARCNLVLRLTPVRQRKRNAPEAESGAPILFIGRL